MKKNFGVLFLIFIFSFLTVQAQTKLKKTIRTEFQLPRAISNKAFTKAFSGVFNMGISMNVGGKHFNAGGFYGLTQYQIFPKFFDNPHSIQTNHTAGIKFSYDRLTSTGKGMFSSFITPGYTFIKYSRIICKTQSPFNTKPSGISMNMGLSYNIMMDEWVGAGFIVGFNAIDHVFNPNSICLNEFIGFEESDRKGSMQSIFFGFTLYFDLARKPETAE